MKSQMCIRWFQMLRANTVLVGGVSSVVHLKEAFINR